jgi:hypothetical protein
VTPEAVFWFAWGAVSVLLVLLGCMLYLIYRLYENTNPDGCCVYCDAGMYQDCEAAKRIMGK